MHINKSQTLLVNSIDKSNVFVEVHSHNWKSPSKISLEDLLKNTSPVVPLEFKKYDISSDIDNNTLIIDKKTLKIKVNSQLLITPSVHSDLYSNQSMNYNLPPINASVFSGVHLAVDENYLYIWINNRWKRCLLSTW